MNKQRELNYIKSEFKNYKYLNSLVVSYLEKLTELKHARDGLPSPNYDGLRIENHYSEVNPLTIIDEQIAKVEKRLESVALRIEAVDGVLGLMDSEIAKSVKRLYIYKSATLDGLALENCMSVQSFKTLISNEIISAYTIYTSKANSS